VVFLYTRIHSLLINSVVTALSHALWRVLSNKGIWVLGIVQICRLWVRHFPCCMLFLINCFRIEMVLCDLYLKRFELTKSLLFYTFSIAVWYKYAVMITQYWSWNHLNHQWIGRQNKNLQIKCIPVWAKKYEKNAWQARFFINQKAPKARLIKQNAPQARFSWPSPNMCTLCYWYSILFIFSHHSSKSSSFN